jgi:hypothetical protein
VLTRTDVQPATPLVPSLIVPAALLGALLVLAGDVYHLFVLHDRPTQAGSPAYRLHGVALMLGLALLVMASLSVARAGRLAAVALPLIVLGNALVIGDIWAEVVVLPGVVFGEAPKLLSDDIGGAHLAMVIGAYALFALGWLLYGLSMRPASGAASWVLVVGAVLGFLPIGGSYVLLALGAAAVVQRAARD